MNTEMTMKWHSICKVEEIPRLGGRTVRLGQMEIAVFRLSDGRIRAVDNRCPHKQGPLAEGIVSGDTIICPLHARKINLETGEVLKPDSGCVKTWPARVENGQVFLSVG
jgi:nitrite reductase (NADH) small subunit